jgi:protein ImuB
MLICCLVGEGVAVPGALEAVARACSPRVEPHGDAAVLFDASGLTRALGAPAAIAADVCLMAAARGARVRVALAGSSTTAWLLAHARPGISLVAAGEDRAALAALPLRALAALPGIAAAAGPAPRRRQAARARNFRAAPGPQTTRPPAREPGPALAGVLATLDRWGIVTVGDIARLARADLHARFGETGVRLHQAAHGEDAGPLVPDAEATRFLDRIDLEWPIEGIEPLSFVLARACETLCGALARADRGAVGVTTRLRLVTRAGHERRLQWPAPMRDARVLRTLILLDLESHPPGAAIDAVEIEFEVAPGRIVQGSLLARSLPSPETLSTLLARLGALMGESRVGAPAVQDTHDERVAAMETFQVKAESRRVVGQTPASADPLAVAPGVEPAAARACLRRFRLPLAVRVTVERGVPVDLLPRARGESGGRIRIAAGPWRTSGRWWARDRTRWDRDEWDVALADGRLYRLAHDRHTGLWEIDGILD